MMKEKLKVELRPLNINKMKKLHIHNSEKTVVDKRIKSDDCHCFSNQMTGSNNFLATDIKSINDEKLQMRCANILFAEMEDQDGNMMGSISKVYSISSATITLKLSKNVKYMMQSPSGIIDDNKVGKKLFFERIKNPLSYFEIKRDTSNEIIQIFESTIK